VSSKARVIDLISQLPDDATYEDILYEIEFLERLDLSEHDIREGRFFTHDELKERMKQWISPNT
jgi:predicted transcriptional regulator